MLMIMVVVGALNNMQLQATLAKLCKPGLCKLRWGRKKKAQIGRHDDEHTRRIRKTQERPPEQAKRQRHKRRTTTGHNDDNQNKKHQDPHSNEQKQGLGKTRKISS